MKKSLFDDRYYEELISRVNKLRPDSTPLWGKMSVSQMMAHCNVAFDGPLGKIELKDHSNFLFRTLVKWIALSRKPFRKGLPTAKEYTINSERDFQQEKKLLIENIKAAHSNTSGPWKQHVVFGKLAADEWGQLLYKHTDHHLQQFGV
jgi:hypothetical protein